MNCADDVLKYSRECAESNIVPTRTGLAGFVRCSVQTVCNNVRGGYQVSGRIIQYNKYKPSSTRIFDDKAMEEIQALFRV